MSLRILSDSDVSKVTTRFSPDELVNLMADVFSRLSKSDPGVMQPPRTTVPSGNHTCLFMPSRVASAGTTMKVVAVPTTTAPLDVKERGLPASTIVVDERSGGVRAIVNARNLTGLRNAAGMSQRSYSFQLAFGEASPSYRPLVLSGFVCVVTRFYHAIRMPPCSSEHAQAPFSLRDSSSLSTHSRGAS